MTTIIDGKVINDATNSWFMGSYVVKWELVTGKYIRVTLANGQVWEKPDQQEATYHLIGEE